MAKILIFDSGVGGLSIAEGIYRAVPDAQLIFASDNAAYPYGTKTEQELIPRVLEVVDALIAETAADILVVACNTASTVVLPSLREKLSIPVVGVVPAIKPAIKLSNNDNIGVLATPATIKRQYTLDLIETFASESNVSLLGSSELVDLAEHKLHKGSLDNAATKQLESVVKPWLAQGSAIDTIVLACTHFPLLEAELNAVFEQHGKVIQWVDSRKGIAKRVAFLLEQEGIDCDKNQLKNQAIFTKEVQFSEQFKQALKKGGIEECRVIYI